MVTPELLKQDISVFFEANADGTYPLYWWEPGEFNSRIPPQHSVFLFGATRTIEPNEECIILGVNKRSIVDSIEGFSQTTETTLFPDFEILHSTTYSRQTLFPKAMRVTGQLVIEHIDGKIIKGYFLL